jgi:hypothetical protein
MCAANTGSAALLLTSSRPNAAAWSVRGTTFEALEDENAKLKKLLTEAMLDNAMLKDLSTGRPAVAQLAGPGTLSSAVWRKRAELKRDERLHNSDVIPQVTHFLRFEVGARTASPAVASATAIASSKS